MSLTIQLPEPMERQLAARAAREGKPPAALALELLGRQLTPTQTLAEVMAPFAAEFAASGMTEEGLDALVEEARKAIWLEKQAVSEVSPVRIVEPLTT